MLGGTCCCFLVSLDPSNTIQKQKTISFPSLGFSFPSKEIWKLATSAQVHSLRISESIGAMCISLSLNYICATWSSPMARKLNRLSAKRGYVAKRMWRVCCYFMWGLRVRESRRGCRSCALGGLFFRPLLSFFLSFFLFLFSFFFSFFHFSLALQIFKCPLCAKTYDKPDSLQNHVKTKHDLPPRADDVGQILPAAIPDVPGAALNHSIHLGEDLDQQAILQKYNLAINKTYHFVACVDVQCGFALTQNWDLHCLRQHKKKVTGVDRDAINQLRGRVAEGIIPNKPQPVSGLQLFHGVKCFLCPQLSSNADTMSNHFSHNHHGEKPIFQEAWFQRKETNSSFFEVSVCVNPFCCHRSGAMRFFWPKDSPDFTGF